MTGKRFLGALTEPVGRFGDAVGRNKCLQEYIMKFVILSSMLAASIICAPVAFATDSDSSSDHHFVKDSVITTKVKSKLAAKHLTTLTRIKVDTDENGVVWLSGRAPNQDAADMATMIAKDTEGVNSVHNAIAIQPN
jgi:hyperosmotically inducible periplasmic protein